MGDDDLWPYGADVLDDQPRYVLQRGVAEPGPVGRGVADAGIGESQHARRARSQDVQGVGEFTGPVAVGRPSGGDHGGRGASGGALREDAAGQEGLAIGAAPQFAYQRRMFSCTVVFMKPSALKQVRLDLNLTQEEACDRLNAITGGTTPPTLLSAWESGRKRTGLRNRRALCELYGEDSRALFAHQDGREATTSLAEMGTANVERLLTRHVDLIEGMIEVVLGAKEQLVVTGSRSREPGYLAAIENAVAGVPDLIHYRVLYGPPRHLELRDHLARLLELRDPAARRNGVQSLHIGLVESPSALERHFVASESAAVIPLPSFHGADGFDCGVMLGAEVAAGLVQHGREACASARPVETLHALDRLPGRPGPELLGET
ncbi:helix-turn-helix transcriptional regulator [Streptomyces sp. NPDC093108]|uniref:helix-turn-helix transcriptional regulator n=1 Tax=Streptomyces sp. NPDC093108 TaxID=3366030 RepID=UPI00382EA5C5